MLRRCIGALVTLATFALTGCHFADSAFNAHGPAANSIANMAFAMVILFLVTIFIMWALLAFAFYRRRGTLEEHAPIDSSGGQAWIAIGGFAIPVLILTGLFVFGLELLREFPIHGVHGASNQQEMAKSMKPEIEVIGHQWWWEIHYLNDDASKAFTTANEIHIPAGRPVNIELETADVMHSFWVPALHGKVDLIPAQPNYIRIEAAQPGEYTGQCAEFCGAEHARMRILVVAQSPGEYEAWREAQLKASVPPVTPEAKSGEQIFLAGPCSMCHMVRGTVAGGTVAPDLTHIGSRMMIAANTYQNNDAYLEAWITHAQSLKPGALMPNLTHFNGEQLADLVAYLRQLK